MFYFLLLIFFSTYIFQISRPALKGSKATVTQRLMSGHDGKPISNTCPANHMSVYGLSNFNTVINSIYHRQFYYYELIKSLLKLYVKNKLSQLITK